MICCGSDLGKGKPVVMYSYWCAKCETEHLLDARELDEIVVKLHARIDELEQLNAVAPLPSIL